MADNQDNTSDLTQESAASFKAYMLQNSTKSNMNLYDHLTRVLMKVLDEQPQDVVDVIEDISYDVKQGLFEDKKSNLKDLPDTTTAEQLAELQTQLFSQSEDEEEEDDLEENPLPNVSEIGFYMEQAGVSIGKEELQRSFLALKQLVKSQGLQYCRLWGKILGTESNYIVAEADSKEEEEEEEAQDVEAEEKDMDETQQSDEDEMDPLPQSTYKPPPVVPKEPPGTGANKFTYYVCKEPGLSWVKLPTVTPAQITSARHIRKFFTGRLDAKVNSYPPFPGKEVHYLRAQIARISAGTQVSPYGYFHTGSQEEDEEEETVSRNSFDRNPDFGGIPITEMADRLSSWVHSVQHILQQGRCTWVNLAAKPEKDSDEEEDEEEEEDEDQVEPDVGPPLLTTLTQDAQIDNTPPWSSKISSNLTSKHAIAVLRSNLWPGAYAYAHKVKFENIYVGWGLKYTEECYSPPAPPVPQKEYSMTRKITEAEDPSVEEEKAMEAQEESEEESEEDTDEDDEE